MSEIIETPSTGKNPHPQLYNILKREMETKIPKDYEFERAPDEYNTWLVFRRVVDLILMSYGGRPVNESLPMTVARWFTGIALVAFNLWVKLDAPRVVKDYAWYWGDFFYLIDQELTFDGVFELALHPMYSVGYAGYYRMSLIAASHKVLFISIVAHAAQFAFLALVENPHIETTYNSPPPRRRTIGSSKEQRPGTSESNVGHVNESLPLASTQQPSPVHNLIGLPNTDLCRVTDISNLLLQFYVFVLAVSTPSTTLYQTIFMIHALLWRLWYSLGICFLLGGQSNKKKWTRHSIKYGESTEEARRQ
ncbi:phosphatidylethanolamine N-methyltransferase [Elasticomyces elasticus]|nr:phosphatidylethanolamine N-methyltransferase [Elasticomyces elasticus]